MTTMVEHGGLLVPAEAVPTASVVEAVPAADVVEAELVEDRDEDQAVETAEVARHRRKLVTAEGLRARLTGKRQVAAVRREDVLERAADTAEHEIALADVREDTASARRRRRERVRDERSAAELSGLYRRAALDGTRARIRADIDRSAEMRALRVALVRRGAMWVGLPVLAGFALWSTAGVQAGMARLLDLEAGSAGWWAAWIVEPLLIAVAAGVIVVKALLRSSGGQTDWRAEVAKWGALVVSIALNMLGGWTGQHGWASAVGEALGHSVGAVGAAVTAWLIGVVIDYASKARPWEGEGVQRLADMGLLPDAPPTPPMTSPTPTNLGGPVVPTTPLPPVREVPQEDRRLLEDTCTAIEDGTLPTAPSGWQIYQRLMGRKGDKRRAYRVADLVAGWQPGQPVPADKPVNGQHVNGTALAVTR
uniref:hypothetical protein n=1 Tax=Micromonospora carbonacea TaxID=47853 RepID=UPI003B20C4A3